MRGAFAAGGKLANTKDTNFRPINQDWPVFGYAVDLGNVQSAKPTATLFSIGLYQQEAVQFNGKDGNVTLPSLWTSYFDDDVTALSFFHKDFSESDDLTSAFDEKVDSDSKNAAGDDYAILTTLAARQALGATQLVGTQEKHYLFLKEISSNGNMQTIDVIYPATPFFYYANPELVKLLLDPHFENQESGRYPNKWAIHDLGTHYPNATGHEAGDDEPMPVEECGNNIIMGTYPPIPLPHPTNPSQSSNTPNPPTTRNTSKTTTPSSNNGSNTSSKTASTPPSNSPPTTSPATSRTKPTSPSKASSA